MQRCLVSVGWFGKQLCVGEVQVEVTTDSDAFFP